MNRDIIQSKKVIYLKIWLSYKHGSAANIDVTAGSRGSRQRIQLGLSLGLPLFFWGWVEHVNILVKSSDFLKILLFSFSHIYCPHVPLLYSCMWKPTVKNNPAVVTVVMWSACVSER